MACLFRSPMDRLDRLTHLTVFRFKTKHAPVHAASTNRHYIHRYIAYKYGICKKVNQ